VTQRPLLSSGFDHQEHGDIRPATCHHNFFDDTGRDACYFYREIRPALAARIKQGCHLFCRDCHARVAARSVTSGPLRRCSGCHADGSNGRFAPATRKFP
jgi:hypothetical protein